MTLIDSITQFSDEDSSKQKFKEYRNQVGIICPKCGGSSHYHPILKNYVPKHNAQVVPKGR